MKMFYMCPGFLHDIIHIPSCSQNIYNKLLYTYPLSSVLLDSYWQLMDLHATMFYNSTAVNSVTYIMALDKR